MPMPTKCEAEFIAMANKWLADNLGNDDMRTTVWNGISAMCNAIQNEKHDEIAAFTASVFG